MNKGRLINAVLFLMVFVAICARFIDYVALQDFTVYSYGTCDPAVASCFASDCDPLESACDPTPYSKLALPDRSTPHCVLEFACDEEFICDASTGCVETFCSAETLEEGEICVDSKS